MNATFALALTSVGCLFLISVSPAQAQSLNDFKLGFQQEYDQKIDASYRAEKRLLSERYLAAAKRSLEETSKTGNLDATLSIKSEVQLFESGGLMPSVDGDEVPVSIRKLRSVFRTEAAKICRAYILKMAPLTKNWDDKAQTLESALTKQSDFDAAKRVRTWREQIKEKMNLFDPKPRLIKRAEIPANKEDGFGIGSVAPGAIIKLQFAGGMWKAWGQNATENPDLPVGGAETPEKQDQCRLVIAESSSDGGRVLAKIPPNTRQSPFVYVAEKLHTSIVLRINDTIGSFSENPGAVFYDITIIPPVLP